MGLVLLQIDSWHSVRPEKWLKNRAVGSYYAYGDYYLLNTNRMVDIISLDMGHVQFKYNQSPDDHRCSPDTITANVTLQSLITAQDAVPTSKFVTLPIFPTADITRIGIDTPIDTEIEYDDIAIAYATIRDFEEHGVFHLVYYRNSFERVHCIVNLSLLDGLALLSDPVEDYDGNVYFTINVGTREWIVQNLRTTHYGNGTAIPNVTDDALWPADTTGAYCVYDNDLANKDDYGLLYNWHAVNNANGLAYFTRAGVAEAGWRVATVADFTALSAAYGGDIVSGGPLKERGLAHWDSPNTSATNASGFRSVGAGNRFVDSDLGDGFIHVKVFNDIWTADELDATDAFSVWMHYYSATFHDWNHEKFGGMSVRCVRDIV